MLFGKNRHVISASRRTDIPAFYAEWFMDKIRKGFCKVANPYNPSQVKEVSLCPDEVAAVVFWTRYAKPLRPFLAELDERGFNYYFLYTITGYPSSYESGLPSSEECIEDFLALGECIGAEKVIWRYDPVILSSRMHMSFHMKNFERLALRLSAGTKKVIVTFVKKYRHIEEKLEEMEYVPPSSHERQVLEKHFRSLTSDAGMQIQRCGKRDSFANVSEGKCVDEKLMRELFGLELSSGKDPGQPEECRCIRSIDIGRYGSCLHRCVYCYASRNFFRAARRYQEHDYSAEML
ncbi:hypothetical protein CR164_02685 [Prosthecochloris marina]|uniref:DNA repair photolyase n=1 Tax=Prosthecochloris marina TaxID=2017681 RepID=A0A317T7P0_9CHLB|nr:DUF1848 domain-containing protein [Prosthecochloris marina]PWW82672.1 hypothetical protein CR164_02685 [Prosthecochloris marina]